MIKQQIFFVEISSCTLFRISFISFKKFKTNYKEKLWKENYEKEKLMELFLQE